MKWLWNMNDCCLWIFCNIDKMSRITIWFCMHWLQMSTKQYKWKYSIPSPDPMEIEFGILCVPTLTIRTTVAWSLNIHWSFGSSSVVVVFRRSHARTIFDADTLWRAAPTLVARLSHNWTFRVAILIQTTRTDGKTKPLTRYFPQPSYLYMISVCVADSDVQTIDTQTSRSSQPARNIRTQVYYGWHLERNTDTRATTSHRDDSGGRTGRAQQKK